MLDFLDKPDIKLEVVKENLEEINKLKNQVYKNKEKRTALIESITDKLKTELESRDLSEVSTPQLMVLLLKFTELSKKENPTIELVQGYKPGRGKYDTQKISF